MIRVTIYNEHVQEQMGKKVFDFQKDWDEEGLRRMAERAEEIAAAHEGGAIHDTVKKIAEECPDVEVRHIATFEMPSCGLTEEVLEDTDVLIWWSHVAQDLVPYEVAMRTARLSRELHTTAIPARQPATRAILARTAQPSRGKAHTTHAGMLGKKIREMKIVALDGYAAKPGDISWEAGKPRGGEKTRRNACPRRSRKESVATSPEPRNPYTYRPQVIYLAAVIPILSTRKSYASTPGADDSQIIVHKFANVRFFCYLCSRMIVTFGQTYLQELYTGHAERIRHADGRARRLVYGEAKADSPHCGHFLTIGI